MIAKKPAKRKPSEAAIERIITQGGSAPKKKPASNKGRSGVQNVLIGFAPALLERLDAFIEEQNEQSVTRITRTDFIRHAIHEKLQRDSGR